MLFPEHKGSDYTITVRLTLRDGEKTGDFQYKEAGVVFRYNDLNRFYYAGVGGFRARRFIGLARCFVVMPFSAPFNFVYSAIKEEAEENGYLCAREDERSLAQMIVEDVKAQVASADLIIADLSSANPNVYYEVGLAHSLGKKVILLAQSVEDVTFDLRHIRYELYATPQQLREKLRDAIKQLAAEALI